MTFSIGFCFLPGETKEDFVWAFQCFQGLKINPAIIVIDSDQALRNILKEVFLDTSMLLCIWYINQCVFAKYKSIVKDKNWLVFGAA